MSLSRSPLQNLTTFTRESVNDLCARSLLHGLPLERLTELAALFLNAIYRRAWIGPHATFCAVSNQPVVHAELFTPSADEHELFSIFRARDRLSFLYVGSVFLVQPQDGVPYLRQTSPAIHNDHLGLILPEKRSYLSQRYGDCDCQTRAEHDTVVFDMLPDIPCPPSRDTAPSNQPWPPAPTFEGVINPSDITRLLNELQTADRFQSGMVPLINLTYLLFALLRDNFTVARSDQLAQTTEQPVHLHHLIPAYKHEEELFSFYHEKKTGLHYQGSIFLRRDPRKGSVLQVRTVRGEAPGQSQTWQQLYELFRYGQIIPKDTPLFERRNITFSINHRPPAPSVQSA